MIKSGNVGIALALGMLLVAWTLIAISKLLF
jgi:hypothetical protein